MNVDQKRAIEYYKCKHTLDTLIFSLYSLELNESNDKERIDCTKQRVSDHLLHMYNLQPHYFLIDYDPNQMQGVRVVSKLYTEVYNETKRCMYEM